MFTLSKKQAIICAGTFMFFGGVSLFTKGVALSSKIEVFSFPFSVAHGYFDFKGTLFFIALVATFLGFLKGRFVISKTVSQNVERIKALAKDPFFFEFYAPKTWVILFAMVLLARTISSLDIPLELRIILDIAVGTALFYGSMLFFFHARKIA